MHGPINLTFVAYFVEIGAMVQRLKKTHPHSDIIKSQDYSFLFMKQRHNTYSCKYVVDKCLNKEIDRFSGMGVSFKVFRLLRAELRYSKHRNHDDSSGNGNGSSIPLPVSRTCPFVRQKNLRCMKPHPAVTKVACIRKTADI
jgi:hypothetical protein